MTNENSGFDAGAFYDEGMKAAGLSGEETVNDSPDQDESTNAASQVSDETKETKPESEPAAEAKPTEGEKETSSAEDVQEAIDSTKEAEQQVESVISALLPEPEASQKTADPLRTGKYVPVEDHIKLRERAQAAERDRDEFKQRLETSTNLTGGEKPGEVEKSPLEKFVEENPDEDLVPVKVQLAERKFLEAR